MSRGFVTLADMIGAYWAVVSFAAGQTVGETVSEMEMDVPAHTDQGISKNTLGTAGTASSL